MIFLFLSLTGVSQETCNIRNEAFKDGEEMTYKIIYNWGFIWLHSAEITFRANKEHYLGRDRYHFSGIGFTYPKYDWFFKVRDKYESYADTSTLKPFRFTRNVNEGGNYCYDDYIFSYTKNKILTGSIRNKNALVHDSIKLPPCSYDVATAVYAARCLDFSNTKVNDTISFTLVLDNKIFPVHIRYMGKEIYKSEELGSFRCIKFKAMLLAGTLFKGGEDMTVWVTDDKNKVPLYVESAIVVGSIKVKLSSYKNLRNEMSSKVSE